MAYATLTLKNPNTGQLRAAPVGFSWTTFFFGIFVPLLRKDLVMVLVMLVLGIVTFGIAFLVFPFIYNKIYLKGLLKRGYRVSSGTLDPELVEHRLGFELPRVQR